MRKTVSKHGGNGGNPKLSIGVGDKNSVAVKKNCMHVITMSSEARKTASDSFWYEKAELNASKGNVPINAENWYTSWNITLKDTTTGRITNRVCLVISERTPFGITTDCMVDTDFTKEELTYIKKEVKK